MNKTVVQAVVLIAAAFVLAVVSNAIASRERRLVLPGYYPNTSEAAADLGRRDLGARGRAPLHVEQPVAPAPPPVEKPKPVLSGAPPPPAAHAKPNFAPHPDKPYIEIGGKDAALLHSNGALELDARRSSAYEQGHIAGARSFSVWESDIDDKVNKLYEERSDPREQLKPILVYCSGGDCEDSHMLAQKLWGVQFNNVYVYKDGFPDWQKRRGPIHTGSNP